MISTILRQCEFKNNYNILLVKRNPRYDSALISTEHNFFTISLNNNPWKQKQHTQVFENENYLGNIKKPEEVLLLIRNNLPLFVDLDLCIIQNRVDLQTLFPLINSLHLNTINIEHMLPEPSWFRAQFNEIKSIKGNISVYTSNLAKSLWEDKNGEVIHPIIDRDTFSFSKEKNPVILTAANNFHKKPEFQIWQQIIKDLPFKLLGKNLEEAQSFQDLVDTYKNSLIYFHISNNASFPTSLLEAAACGCAIVTGNNDAVKEIFTHNKNAYLSNDGQELRGVLQRFLNNPEEAQKLGQEARKTIEQLDIDSFNKDWSKLFEKASKRVFK